MAVYGFDETKNKVEVPSVDTFEVVNGDDITEFVIPPNLRVYAMSQILTVMEDIPVGGYIEKDISLNMYKNPELVKAFAVPTSKLEACPVTAETGITYKGADLSKAQLTVRLYNVGKQAITAQTVMSFNVLMLGEKNG